MALLAHLVEDSEASADLCMKAGWYLHELGHYSESLILYERARELRVVSFGEETTKTLHAMYSIGFSLQVCGQLKEAQEIQVVVLEVRRRIHEEEHQDTLDAMQNLAITYREQGRRLKEAQELDEMVLEVRKRTLGEGHRGTADAMYTFGLTLYDLERLDEAISLMEEAAGSYARIYGSDHSETKDAERVAKRWKDKEQDDGGAHSTYGEGAEDSDEAE
jgi:tetratricopeptide (TPR) repeat protein